MNIHDPSQSKKYSATVILLTVAVVVMLIVFIPSKVFPISMDFRNNLWAPSMLLVHGQSPYNIQVLFEQSNATWMPMVVGLLFPVGFLPLQWASNLFMLLNLTALLTLIFLVTQRAHWRLSWSLMTLFALVVFPAMLSQFFLGQVSLLISLALLFLIYYFNSLPPWLISGLLAFSFTKPQLAILFLPTFLMFYLRAFGLQKTIRVAAFCALWVIGLCLPLFFFHPAWIPDFLTSLAGNNRWYYPTVYALMLNSTVLRGAAVWLAGAWLALGIALTVFLSFRMDRIDALLWCLALTPVFSPIVWSWDFVLVLPLLLTSIVRVQTKLSFGLLLGGYTLCTAIFILLRLGENSDHLAVWVPLALNAIIWMSDRIRLDGAKRRIMTGD